MRNVDPGTPRCLPVAVSLWLSLSGFWPAEALAADDIPAAASKPPAPASTSAPAVPLSAEQRAQLAAKRAATIMPAPAPPPSSPTKLAPRAFSERSSMPALELQTVEAAKAAAAGGSLEAAEPAIIGTESAIRDFIRMQGRETALRAGVLKSVNGVDVMVTPVATPAADPNPARTSNSKAAPARGKPAPNASRTRGGR